MGVSGKRAHISWAVQEAGYIGDGAFVPGTGFTWWKHRLTEADIGTQEMVDQISPEIGGGLFPTGRYKNGAFFGGTIGMEARLAGSLGALLYAAGGSKVETVAVAGVTSRITRFGPDATDDTILPLLAMRKYIPDEAGNAGQTEYGLDCIVSGLQMTIPQVGTLKTAFTVVGRKPIGVDGEVATGNAYEDAKSVALSCQSQISLPVFSTELGSATGGKFTGAQVTIVNQTTDPTQEMIIGGYHPDRFLPLSRSCMVRLIYKWKDPALYRSLRMKAAVSGQRPWRPDIVSGAVDITAASANLVPTFTNPYKLVFHANADWAIGNPVPMPNQFIQVELTGVVTQVSGGQSWYADLYNDLDYTF